MKIYTSYFYKVRFFHKNTVAFSTAMWDPKWFHSFQSQDYCFYDRRGVINGLRIDPLVPGPTCNGLCRGPDSCDCGDANICSFLKQYAAQLDALDFPHIYSRMQEIAREAIGDETPEFVLLVHEAPVNPCSERWPIQKWLQKNGVETEEWHTI